MSTASTSTTTTNTANTNATTTTTNTLYVLTNPAMMKMVKIGRTNREMAKHLKELFTTGVPVAFDCAYAGLVEDSSQVEKDIHAHFVRKRLSPNCEYFLITARTAIKAIKPYELEDITLKVRDEVDSLLSDKERAERKAARKKLEELYPSAVASRELHRLVKR
jgi:hypothetical protein